MREDSAELWVVVVKRRWHMNSPATVRPSSRLPQAPSPWAIVTTAFGPWVGHPGLIASGY